MNLPCIAKLLVSMKTQNILRQKYKFTYNGKTVEIMLFTDENPFQLLLGVFGTHFSKTFDITKYGDINAYLEDAYSFLRSALGINSNNPGDFKPRAFFKYADSHSPIVAKVSATVKPQDRFRYDKNIEEADKIYFIGYRDNTNSGGHVTNTNYEKTCKAFGKTEADFLRNKNVSTRWTDNSADEVEFFRL